MKVFRAGSQPRDRRGRFDEVQRPGEIDDSIRRGFGIGQDLLRRQARSGGDLAGILDQADQAGLNLGVSDRTLLRVSERYGGTTEANKVIAARNMALEAMHRGGDERESLALWATHDLLSAAVLSYMGEKQGAERRLQRVSRVIDLIHDIDRRQHELSLVS